MTAPRVHTAADLADLRLWLVEQWQPGRPFHRIAAPFQSSRVSFRRTRDGAERYAHWERNAAGNATLWWVGEDMVDVLMATAESIPEDVMAGDLHPPSPAGMVVFAKPWMGTDAEGAGKAVQVDAMLWAGAVLPPLGRPQDKPGEGVLSLSASLYRRVDFASGLGPYDLQLAMSVGALQHARSHPEPVPTVEGRPATADDIVEMGPESRSVGFTGQRDDGTLAMSVRLTGESWLPLGRSDWPAVDRLGDAPWEMPEHGRQSYMEDRKVLAAMWVLLHQEGIATRTIHKAPRQTARRTERAGVARELADVQVVTLRKLHATEHEPDPDHEPEGRTYSHRWLVQGHFRWQACGPQRSERRLTFVRPHVKGPDDKPLKVPTRVNAWVR